MNTKLNNEGLTLVELIVAVAIAAIVSLLIATMMVNGTSMFGRESRTIDLQNDLQVIQNQLTEKLMEAKSITVVRSGDDVRIYTGPVNYESNKLIAETGGGKYTDCIITYKDKKLYITSTYMEDIPEGYLLSNYVTDFDLKIATEQESEVKEIVHSNGTTEEKTVYYYEGPISVELQMKIGNGIDDNEKNANVKVKIRNEIETYDEYSVGGINDKLNNYEAETKVIK